MKNEKIDARYIAAARKLLPEPRPEAGPQAVEVDAWPQRGRYRITFVILRDPAPHTHTWSWSFESAELIEAY